MGGNVNPNGTGERIVMSHAAARAARATATELHQAQNATRIHLASVSGKANFTKLGFNSSPTGRIGASLARHINVVVRCTMSIHQSAAAMATKIEMKIVVVISEI
jgi:hypothetical protein